jgi:hypothetical protein
MKWESISDQKRPRLLCKVSTEKIREPLKKGTQIR